MAYIVYDVRTGTLLLTQKLQHVVEHINSAIAESRHERVTLQGMYEAIDTMQNTLEGWHKHRYRVTRCVMQTAHLKFEDMRQLDAVKDACILSPTPDHYGLATTGGVVVRPDLNWVR